MADDMRDLLALLFAQSTGSQELGEQRCFTSLSNRFWISHGRESHDELFVRWRKHRALAHLFDEIAKAGGFDLGREIWRHFGHGAVLMSSIQVR